MMGVTSKTLATGALLNAHYVVPDYQREYRWTKDEINAFWADFLPVIDGTRSELYLGTFYCELIRDDAAEKAKAGETLDGSELQHFELIDGQQRLTTVQLLLAVLQDELDYLEPLLDAKEKASANRLEGKVSNLLYWEDSGSENLRLQSNNESDFANELLLDNKKYEARLKIAEDHLSGVAPKCERYAAGYKILLEKFEKLVDTEEPAKRLKWAENVVKAIGDLLFVRLVIENLPAHEIFERVNNRGLRLDSSELVKNYLFAEASKTGDLSRVKAAWGDALKEFRGNSGLKFQEVLHYFIILKQDTNAKEKDLQKDSEKCIDSLGPAKFANELKKFADRIHLYHQHVLPATAGRHVDEIGYGLRTLMKRFSFLVVGSTYLAPEKDSKAVHICRLMEMHTFRFMHVHEVARKKDMFATFCRRTAALVHSHLLQPKSDWDLDRLLDVIETNMLEALSDSKFEEDFSYFHEISGRTQEYVLRKLEIFASGGHQSPTPRGKNENIEHIYPKNPHPGYAQGRGFDRRKDVDWAHMAKFHDPAKISQADRGRFINRIGNLALLEAKINNSIKNKGISFKISNSLSTDPDRPTCYKDSTYNLVQDIYTYASDDGTLSGVMTWDENTIAARQKELAKKALGAWKVSKVPPK